MDAINQLTWKKSDAERWFNLVAYSYHNAKSYSRLIAKSIKVIKPMFFITDRTFLAGRESHILLTS